MSSDINIGPIPISYNKVLIDPQDNLLRARKHKNTVADLRQIDVFIKPDVIPNAPNNLDAIRINNLPAGDYEVELYGGHGNDNFTSLGAPTTLTSDGTNPIDVDLGDDEKVHTNMWIKVSKDGVALLTKRLYFNRCQQAAFANPEAYIDRAKIHYQNNPYNPVNPTDNWTDFLVFADESVPDGSTVLLYYYKETPLPLELIEINSSTGGLSPGHIGITKNAGTDLAYPLGTFNATQAHEKIVIKVTAPDGSIVWYGAKGLTATEGVTEGVADDYVPLEFIRNAGTGQKNFLNLTKFAYCGAINSIEDSLIFGGKYGPTPPPEGKYDGSARDGSRITITSNGDTRQDNKSAGIFLLPLGDDNPNFINFNNVSLVVDNDDDSDAISYPINFTSMIYYKPSVSMAVDKTPGAHSFDFTITPAPTEDLLYYLSNVTVPTPRPWMTKRSPNANFSLPEINSQPNSGGYNVPAETDSNRYDLKVYNRGNVELFNTDLPIAFDSTAPSQGIIIVNGGFQYTDGVQYINNPADFSNADVAITGLDGQSGIARYRIADTATGLAAADWNNYSASPTTINGYNITPAAEGVASPILVEFEDFGGNTLVKQLDVILDQTMPHIPVAGELTAVEKIGLNITSGVYASLLVKVQDDISGILPQDSNVDINGVNLVMRPEEGPGWLIRVPMKWDAGSIDPANTSTWVINIGPQEDAVNDIRAVDLSLGNYEYCAEIKDKAGNVYYSPIQKVNITPEIINVEREDDDSSWCSSEIALRNHPQREKLLKFAREFRDKFLIKGKLNSAAENNLFFSVTEKWVEKYYKLSGSQKVKAAGFIKKLVADADKFYERVEIFEKTIEKMTKNRIKGRYNGFFR